MEKTAFKVLETVEDSWWDYGRKEAVSQSLKAASLQEGSNLGVLDAGAGYGSMYSFLAKYGTVDGFEPEKSAARMAEGRGYRYFYSDITELAAEHQGMYGLVGAFDVLEHVEDDKAFVKKLHALNADGGCLVATVPAFQFLWSKHDETHQHFKRHTAGSMKRLLEQAGYKVVYVRYWNVFLFPAALVLRLAGRTGEGALDAPSPVNKILKGLLWAEARIIRFIPLPFGLSVVIVGKK